MTRGIVIVYPKCPLASVVSVFGSALALGGVYMLFYELVAGIVCIAIGVGLMFFAPVLAKRKRFKLWIKELKSKGVLEALASSKELCFQMYKAYPHKKTIKVIGKYNPTVASNLLSKLKK